MAFPLPRVLTVNLNVVCEMFYCRLLIAGRDLNLKRNFPSLEVGKGKGQTSIYRNILNVSSFQLRIRNGKKFQKQNVSCVPNISVSVSEVNGR